jgi:cytochrome c biogenesis protein CcdA
MTSTVVLAIEGNFAYSFMLGILAAVNPCGFVLLPAYLLYFLGIDSANPAAQRAPIRRALLVSAAVSSGFMLVFLIIGTISRLFTQWIELNAKYAGLLIGIALVVMGLAMLAGWKPSFITPSIGGGRDRSLRTMFILVSLTQLPALAARSAFSPLQFLAPLDYTGLRLEYSASCCMA